MLARCPHSCGCFARFQWSGGNKDRFLVLYRSYAEWAKLVFDWVDSTGQMGGVLTGACAARIPTAHLTPARTVYELLEGDDSAGQEFHGIDQPLMLKILTYMEKQGNAKLFTGTDSSKMGVKVDGERMEVVMRCDADNSTADFQNMTMGLHKVRRRDSMVTDGLNSNTK